MLRPDCLPTNNTWRADEWANEVQGETDPALASPCVGQTDGQWWESQWWESD